MFKAYLHIGHGKTGTSYIQSAFAKNIENLKKEDILYPSPDHIESVINGKISSGNGNKLEEYFSSPNLNYSKVLFSNENLFHTLKRPSDRTIENLFSIGAAEVNILMFIRDPLDHAPSSYQQTIKRGGETWDIDTFFSQYKVPQLVWELIEKLSKVDKVNIKIINYSRFKSDLIPLVENWLEINTDTLSPPTVNNINRSLTLGEIEIQKALNVYLGRSGNLISDPLCNELPNIQSDTILPNLIIQKAMLDRLNVYISNVNSYAGVPNAYSIELKEFEDTNINNFSFSKDQIDLMFKNIGSYINKIRG